MSTAVEPSVTLRPFSLDNVEEDLDKVKTLVDVELSEPYTTYTYRFFCQTWPQLTHFAVVDGREVGAVVGKVEPRGGTYRGYVAMLVVERQLRGRGVGKALVRRVVDTMAEMGVEEVVLEAECTNTGALRLYADLGFVRDKRLVKYYLNGGDAFRLKLLLPLDGVIAVPEGLLSGEAPAVPPTAGPVAEDDGDDDDLGGTTAT